MHFVTLSLLLTAQTAGAPIQPYPTTDVLSAFAEVCRPIESLNLTAVAATRIGWEKFEPDQSSPIASLIELGKIQGTKLMVREGGEMLPVTAFRRRVADEDLVVILSGVKIGEILSTGCRLYDVGEVREIPPAAVEAWLNRPPKKVVKDPAVHVATWEPGYDARHDSLEVYFVPVGSQVIELVKVSGIALKADFVGRVDK